MNTSRMLTRFGLTTGLLLSALEGSGQPSLANRVFVSARSGNNANACDNIATPCQTLAGAVTKLNPNGEVIVLDSGGYGPVTITQGVTIEAAPGVTAFIHPPSGNAVTVNAPGATVTLRGLVLNGGSGDGVSVQAVGTLSVENFSITGFNSGVHMDAGGTLILKHTDVTGCVGGVTISNSSGKALVSIDRCHLDANTYGFLSQTIGPSAVRSQTTATNSTANNNSQDGWRSGNFTSGQDTLFLESCTASGNGHDGLAAFGGDTNSIYFSNCVFVGNGLNDVEDGGNGILWSRTNNTTLGVQGSLNPFPAR